MAVAAKHRHVVDGGYARGEETRARIITAAIDMFGQRGFDAASTRELAASAGVNAPALQYYFDNKEGLFVACVEHIVKRVWSFMTPTVEEAELTLQRDVSDGRLIDAFCKLQARLAEFMFTSADKEEWRLFMARLQAGEGPSTGFELLEKEVTGRMVNLTCGIVGRLLGRPPDDEETLIHTMALRGQLMVFQMARRSAMRNLSWDGVTPERLALLQNINRRHTEVVLRSLVAEGKRAKREQLTARRRSRGH